MFEIIKPDKNTQARLGFFKTARGSFFTPAFFPVATQGTIKGLSSADLEEIGVEGVLVNAYHLFLRPGTEVIKTVGGIHKFMGFYNTIISDSGGYQVFSLESLRKVTSEGVEFQSHIDGKFFFLSPEDIIQIQLDLGTDIILPLDECLKFPASQDRAYLATQRTVDWLKRSHRFLEGEREHHLFFGIVQGATYPSLRERCLKDILNIGVDGIALGGLSVGEPQNLRYNIISFIADILAKENQRYLIYFMGYGKPQDILEAISLGVDLFDCVVPTRFARTGTAFTNRGKIVVRNSPYASDSNPLDEECSCFVCKRFSRAYLRHLFNANEMTAATLLTYHNIWWYKNFMDKIREAIRENRFLDFKREFLSRFKEDNEGYKLKTTNQQLKTEH
jgi:queuine tRNA-ribosyltransferase